MAKAHQQSAQVPENQPLSRPPAQPLANPMAELVSVQSLAEPHASRYIMTPESFEALLHAAIVEKRKSELAGVRLKIEGEQATFFLDSGKKLLSLEHTFKAKSSVRQAEKDAAALAHYRDTEEFCKAATAYAEGFKLFKTSDQGQLLVVLTDDGIKYAGSIVDGKVYLN